VALTREQQNEINRRAAMLSGLTRNPAWAELEAEVDRKIGRLRKTASALALDPSGADQRKLDTIRGTIAALNWFVGVPKHATATLERFLKEQGIEVEADE
jgi:hypothetical protein